MTSIHIETIKCPECRAVQQATVKHTSPYWTYIHTCEKCGYEIMESEWEEIPIGAEQ